MSEREKQDYQARRLNFYNLSDEEEADNVIDLCYNLSDEEEAADNVINLCTLDDTTNDASLLDALLPFDPLEGEGFTLNEPACPPPSPTSSEEEPTILYGEGLLQ